MNCQVSDWTNCNSSCGPGKITREIIEQAKNGGVECEKQLVKECNLGVSPGKKVVGFVNISTELSSEIEPYFFL